MSDVADRRALYLRWRPGRFAEVLGQEHVTRTLRNAVMAGQVAHAYLLCGPRGTGKTSIARILFKAINCEAPHDGDACDACASCQDTSAGRVLDLVEIDAASNRGIDHIRELRERVWISPSQARRKMYILDEAHQLSAPAWDAFLKTLEEPPPHVVFVLATTEVHKVPATILSRCQRFDLGRIALGDLVAHLEAVVAAEGIRAEPAVLQRVARLARGGVRDALSTLDQLVAYSGETITLQAARAVLGLAAEQSLRQAAEALAQRDALAALELVGQLVREGADLRQFLDDLVAYLRALLLARLGASDVLAFEFGADEQAWLESQAAAWQPAALTELVRRLSAVEPKGRDAGQLQVHLELALLEAALDGPAERAAPPALPPAPAPATPADTRREEAGARLPVASPPGPAAPLLPPQPAPPTNGPGGVSAPVARGPLAGASGVEPAHLREAALGEAWAADGAAAETAASGASMVAEGDEHPRAGGAPPDEAVVRHRWTEVKEMVAEQFPMAGIALEAASVVGLRRGELLLAFTSNFHQHTIEADAPCRAAIERVLTEEIGVTCRLRCVPAETRQPALPGDGFLRQVVELFGATGVEPVDDEPADPRSANN